MSPITPDALRALAEAASPGPWGQDGPYWWDGPVCTDIITTDLDRNDVAAITPRNMNGDADAAFIAAANPCTVLALLDTIEALTAAGWEREATIRVLTAERDEAVALLREFEQRSWSKDGLWRDRVSALLARQEAE